MLEIIYESTNVTNTIPHTISTDVTSTVSTNLHNKKVRDKMDSYILCTVL